MPSRSSATADAMCAAFDTARPDIATPHDPPPNKGANARMSHGSKGKNACVCSYSYPCVAIRVKYTLSQVTNPSARRHSADDETSCGPDPGDSDPEVS